METKTSNPSKDKRGALGLVDALGVKALTQGSGLKGLIKSLKSCKSYFHNNLELFHENCDAKQDANIHIMSDTIKVAVFPHAENKKEIPPARLILDTARMLARLMAHAALLETPLAFRGVVTFGELDSSSEYTLGKAVNEAAIIFEQAEGAFIMLAPSALDEWSKSSNEFSNDAEFMKEWCVPIKGGGSYKTMVISPFEGSFTSDQHTEIQTKLLDAMNNIDLSVRMKRQATKAFLDSFKS